MYGILFEALYGLVLTLWVLFVVFFLTRRLYDHMVERGLPSNRAVYYNRKIIHMLAGGLVGILVPYLFSTPAVPLTVSAMLAMGNYLPHRRGRLYYWYQVRDNMYEVHFIVAWAAAILVAYSIGNPWLSILPLFFLSFGDGVTGVVRNTLYGRRTKSLWGNLAMAVVCVPVGVVVQGFWGGVAALASSIVEKFEIGRIDDNITIPLVSLAILTVGPWISQQLPGF